MVRKVQRIRLRIFKCLTFCPNDTTLATNGHMLPAITGGYLGLIPHKISIIVLQFQKKILTLCYHIIVKYAQHTFIKIN